MVSPGFDHRHIPGAIVLGGRVAMKVCNPNNMRYSFNGSVNRDALQADLKAYMERCGHLNEARKEAARSSNIHCLAQHGVERHMRRRSAPVRG